MTALAAARRRALTDAASATADLVVVGGGINGVGTALDAAARGLRVVLVEADDLAVGTSSRSSKLIHGGLRYLEHYQFRLVREALAERHLLATRLAPHLVQLERFLVPVAGPWWEVPYVAAGLTLYDLLGGRRAGRFRLLPPSQVGQRIPQLRRGRVKAVFEYSDGVFDDARYVVAVARTAADLGVAVITRCRVEGWQRSNGRVTGVVATDRLSGEPHLFSGRVVVDATGAFEAETSDNPHLQPSRGIHLVLPRRVIRSEAGMTLRVPGRVVFLIPWGRFWLLGTTDVPHRGPIARPAATSEEVDYLLETVTRLLDVQLDRGDLVAAYAGIRPLVGGGDDTASISREEAIEEREPGLITVRGGKYTTYQRVAARVVDRAGRLLGGLPPSPTADLPLKGAVPRPAFAAIAQRLQALGMEAATARHLVGRYGSEAEAVARVALDRNLATPVVEGLSYLWAEVWWAVHHEWALGIDDVLARRTRIAFEDPDHGAAAAPRVAELLSEAWGWDPQRRAAEVEEYLRSAAVEYGIPSAPGVAA